LDGALAQQQVFREEVNARKAELEETKLERRTQIALAAAERMNCSTLCSCTRPWGAGGNPTNPRQGRPLARPQR
jgi:hypothetical protein